MGRSTAVFASNHDVGHEDGDILGAVQLFRGSVYDGESLFEGLQGAQCKE